MSDPRPVAEETKQLIDEYLRYNRDTGCLIWIKSPRAGIKVGDEIRDCISLSINGVKLWHHRLIWYCHYGEFPMTGLKHVDRNNRNNRIENLVAEVRTAAVPRGHKQGADYRIALAELKMFAARGIGVASDDTKAEWFRRFGKGKKTQLFELQGLADYIK